MRRKPPATSAWPSPRARSTGCPGRFLGVREGIGNFVAEADRIVEQEMHVLRMQRLPFEHG
jgi:hypothetical protein